MFLLWFKVIQFVSIGQELSFYVELLEKTLWEVRYFIALFILMLLPFANAMYILNHYREYRDPDESIVGVYTGSQYIDTIFQQYFVTLGELGSDNFNTFGRNENNGILWVFLFFSTLISQVTMLNMMVTIMGETFNNLNPIKSQV